MSKIENIKLKDIIKEIRFIKFFENGKMVKNEQNKEEYFFSVNGDIENRGYFKFTNKGKELKEKYLFQDREYNTHIKIFVKDNTVRTTISDGLYISSFYFDTDIEDLKSCLNI